MRIECVLVCGVALASCSSAARSVPAAPANNPFAAIRPAGSYRLLFSFNRTDGQQPIGGLTAARQTLYGTTSYGGANGDGVVFAITTAGKQKVLHSFKNTADGQRPAAPLIFVSGALYGTTQDGGKGTTSAGTIFKILPTGKETLLYSFKGTPDGAGPDAGLIDVGGTLYGTTCSGGANDRGSVFKITTSGTEQIVYSFKGTPDGECPEAAVTNVGGTLYGTTSSGGSKSDGTVFKVTTSGTEKILHSFKGKDGGIPTSALTPVKGTLYGTTQGGGANNHGTVFSVTTTGTVHVVYSFKGNGDAADPVAAALVLLNGTLYGTTELGGNRNSGTVFKVTPAGKESVLYSFQGGLGDGSSPSGALALVGGALYGTTQDAGANSEGTVFSLRP